jgi:hypothetical protein
MRARISVSHACGSMPFILAVTIRQYVAAARRPQSHHRQGARAHGANASAHPRRRGDRIRSADFRFWHIAKSCCNAKLSRYRGMADIEQAAPPSIWLKLPTSCRMRSSPCDTVVRFRARSVLCCAGPHSPRPPPLAPFSREVVERRQASHSRTPAEMPDQSRFRTGSACQR